MFVLKAGGVLLVFSICLLPVTLVARHQLKQWDVEKCDSVLGKDIRESYSARQPLRLQYHLSENAACVKSAEKNSTGESWWFTHFSLVVVAVFILLFLGQLR